MQELADIEKEIKGKMEQVEKDFERYLKLINDKRPTPYVDLKCIEIHENMLITSNILNKTKCQILQMTEDINTAKKNASKEKTEDKTSSLILKLYDLTEFHKKTCENWKTQIRKMLKTKATSPLQWGFKEMQHFHKLRESCCTAMDRIIN